MQLALVRHGHRNVEPGVDNGLSSRGRAQVAAVSQKVVPRWAGFRVLSSPKKRCVETAEILANALGQSVEILAELDECRASEGASLFDSRVESVVQAVRLGVWGERVIIVSHSDWLEIAGPLLVGSTPYLQWAPASAHVIEITPKTAHWVEGF